MMWAGPLLWASACTGSSSLLVEVEVSEDLLATYSQEAPGLLLVDLPGGFSPWHSFVCGEVELHPLLTPFDGCVRGSADVVASIGPVDSADANAVDCDTPAEFWPVFAQTRVDAESDARAFAEAEEAAGCSSLDDSVQIELR